MAQTYYRQSAPARPPTNRTPPAVTVASDLLFAAHLLDTTVAAWMRNEIPDEDRYLATWAERVHLHAALGPQTVGADCATPHPTADYLAECAALLRGGVPAPPRPLPAHVGTYRYTTGQGVVITALEGE